MPHAPASYLYLLLIPLVIVLRFWRARRAARASDIWFEPEGDHFIYHPFGRFGDAYLVSADTREAIRAKVKRFAEVAAMVFITVAVGPIALLSLDMPLYLAWRPWIVPARIGVILLFIPIGLLWRVVALRPLYARSAKAPRRISVESVQARKAAARSWWSVGLAIALLGGLAGYCLYLAYAGGNALFAIYGALPAAAMIFNLRTLVTKLRQRAG